MRATACMCVALAAGTHAFVIQPSRCSAKISRGIVCMQSSGSYMERLKAAQEAKAAKKQAAAPPAAVAPATPPAVAAVSEPLSAAAAPFTDEMQEHLQTAINLLSRRLKSGVPLNRPEFDRFEEAIDAIIKDAVPHLAAAAPAAKAAAPAQRQQAAAQGWEELGGDDDDDDDEGMESEGPAWDASKGYGMPVGVRNSYTIDGMDDMSPDDYQAALREKVLKRVTKARKTGNYGNRAANAYLSFLDKSPTWDVKEEAEPEEDFTEY
ncbi:hypothetical protein JKP88DRAFT_227972 [Tribonema minus]|uniref:Uncharacterized protein n=1 Tax=Tribonema minus TaxID=303371 RepID=A0A836C7S9_9STRA|nr:hypothetical protein JKP88DRAFT_227972 [Tribonema minus]